MPLKDKKPDIMIKFSPIVIGRRETHDDPLNK